MIAVPSGSIFVVTGWKGTGGTTLGLRFGSDNARMFVDRSWASIRIELDRIPYDFPITGAFWRDCPEVRGAPITQWLTRHRLAPWPRGQPPRIRMECLGANGFRAHSR